MCNALPTSWTSCMIACDSSGRTTRPSGLIGDMLDTLHKGPNRLFVLVPFAKECVVENTFDL